MEKFEIIIFIISLIFFSGVIWLFTIMLEHEKNHCEKLGGHQFSVYNSRLCISKDGRILE